MNKQLQCNIFPVEYRRRDLVLVSIITIFLYYDRHNEEQPATSRVAKNVNKIKMTGAFTIRKVLVVLVVTVRWSALNLCSSYHCTPLCSHYFNLLFHSTNFNLKWLLFKSIHYDEVWINWTEPNWIELCTKHPIISLSASDNSWQSQWTYSKRRAISESGNKRPWSWCDCLFLEHASSD